MPHNQQHHQRRQNDSSHRSSILRHKKLPRVSACVRLEFKKKVASTMQIKLKSLLIFIRLLIMFALLKLIKASK